MAEIRLAEVVGALREELEVAMSAGEGKQVQFRATSIQVEFQVGITTAAEAKGGVRFWVLDLGGSGSYKSESIQKITLSLDPTLSGGGGVTIAEGVDQNPLGGGTH